MSDEIHAAVIPMPQGSGRPLPGDGLSPAAYPLYRLVAQRGPLRLDDAHAVIDAPMEEVVRAQAELADLGLLRSTSHGWVAVPPAQAIDDLLGAQAARLGEAMESVRVRRGRLSALFEGMAELQRDAPDQVTTMVLGGDERNHHEVMGAADPATSLHALHPGVDYSDDLLASSLRRAERLTSRGVSLRVIHQTASLTRPRLLSYLHELAAVGASVRVRDQLPARMLLVDDVVAVCTSPRIDGTPHTFMLRGVPVLSVLCRVFHSTWLDARPLDHAALGLARRGALVARQVPGAAGVADHVAVEQEQPVDATGQPRRPSASPDGARMSDLTAAQSSVLRALAEGHTDDTIARLLGVTSRTVTRRVAEIYILLGVDTRFQAGIEALRRGLV